MSDPRTTGSLPNTANKAGAEASASEFKAPSAATETTTGRELRLLNAARELVLAINLVSNGQLNDVIYEKVRETEAVLRVSYEMPL